MIENIYYDPPEFLSKIAKIYIDLNYNDLVISQLELMSIADQIWELDDNLSSISFRDQKLANPFPHEECRCNPLFLFRKPFVAEISDGYIVGPNGAATTSNGRIIADSLRYPARHNEIQGQVARAVFSRSYLNARLDRSFSKRQHLSSAVILHRDTKSTAYYHWVFDHLLALRNIEHYEEKTNSKVNIILSEHAPDFVYKILDYTGFGDREIVIWEEQPLKIDTLVVPSWPEPTPNSIEWLRKNIVNQIDHNNIRDHILDLCETTDYIYISRQKATRRVVTNYDSISKVLEKYGVEEIQFEDLTFEEEIILVNSVDGIIGPHGAGLSSIIWSDEISLLELFNGVVIPPFYVIANVLDHDYSAILGEGVGDNRKRDKNIYINVDEFEGKIAENIVT
jgi:capsular polysaccharide biosynthesis protein